MDLLKTGEQLPELPEKNSQESGQDCQDTVIKQDSRALAGFALGTSFAVATLLALWDSIALMPSSESILSWLIRVLGIWVSALILWFVGFLAVLHIMRLITRGVILKPGGVRLWRFGRLIDADSIKAIGIEPQHLFSRIFRLQPIAHRLVIYREKKAGGRLIPQHIPSFLFDPGEFNQFFDTLCKWKFDTEPDSQDVLVGPPRELARLKRAYNRFAWQRRLIAAIIAVGLLMLLGRRTMTNYNYACANKEFKQGHYQEARDRYHLVLRFDPAFPFAWNNLGNTEFNLGNMEAAKECWEKALLLKPDFVEAKVSLAYYYLGKRQFEKAQHLLERALRLAPRMNEALVNMAVVEMQLGHTGKAVKTAHLVLSQDPDNALAACVIAQGRLRLGKPEAALKLIESMEKRSRAGAQLNKSVFCVLVKAEVYMANGDLKSAAQLYNTVLKLQPDRADALTSLSQIKSRQGDYQSADDLLYRACKRNPDNPWPFVVRGNLQLKLGDHQFAAKLLNQATGMKNQDARSYAAEAKLALKLGKLSLSRDLAERSLKIEPETAEAKTVIEKIKKNALPEKTRH